jgi:hypothetical protein
MSDTYTRFVNLQRQKRDIPTVEREFEQQKNECTFKPRLLSKAKNEGLDDAQP